MCIQVPTEARRGTQTPKWVLGTELRSSRRAESTLNHWQPAAPTVCTLKQHLVLGPFLLLSLCFLMTVRKPQLCSVTRSPGEMGPSIPWLRPPQTLSHSKSFLLQMILPVLPQQEPALSALGIRLRLAELNNVNAFTAEPSPPTQFFNFFYLPIIVCGACSQA